MSKAPDKIYCGNNGHGNLSYSTEKIYPLMEEYIRKDTLLEWLEERISDGDDEGLMTNQIANLAYKDVINKINSL